MNQIIISGIQQIGVGVPDAHGAFRWYRQSFGLDIPMFDAVGDTTLMLPYTGGEPHSRHAIMAINLQGGGGLEIWQYTSRTPRPPAFSPQLGDLGIFFAKIKSVDIDKAFEGFKSRGEEIVGQMAKDPGGKRHFFLRDPLGLLFQVVEGGGFYTRGKHATGGACGCLIGVSDTERARALYGDILGYDRVIYDETGVFEDLAPLPGGEAKARRTLLTHSRERKGSFSRLLGPTQIELVESISRKTRKLFQDRYWGDLGFIHICFDVVGMEALKAECEQKGFPFTVDSAESFQMNEASGRFGYIEDPDGTLIEFVETHRIPIVKRLGIFLNLRNKRRENPLPRWLLRFLALGRVKK